MRRLTEWIERHIYATGLIVIMIGCGVWLYVISQLRGLPAELSIRDMLIIIILLLIVRDK